jgi:hypothetical protein
MTRQHNSLATRRAIYQDHGGELRFWLAWVHGEIDGAVQDWFRTQARHDPALQQDIDSIDVPAARHDVRQALLASGYVTPAAAPSAESRTAVVEDLDDITNHVLSGRSAPRPAAGTWVPLASSSRSAARQSSAPPGTSSARGAAPPDPYDEPRRILRQVLGQLTPDERTLLYAHWHARDSCKESLLRVLLPDEDQPPARGELSDYLIRLRRAESRLRQALGDRRDLLRTLRPEQLWRLLAEEHFGGGVNGRIAAPAPVMPARTPARKRRGSDAEVYRRIGSGLFHLLAEVEISLSARHEAAEATQLLQYLVGRESLTQFRELTCWLYEVRARMDLAGDPTFFTARDRLLLWLAPECFVLDGQRPRFALSFRLFLRARLKDYCRRKKWHPTGAKYHDLETAFRALDRQRIGTLVRESVEEAARADDRAPALAGVPFAQALQWLQVAP